MDKSNEAAKVTVAKLNLKKGQMLTIAAPLRREGGASAQKEYYAKAFPMGAQFGLKQLIGLRVDQKMVGDYQPEGLIFFSFPNAASEAQLYAQPEWSAIKALRPEAWRELRLYSSELQENLQVEFRSDKSYTVVVATTNPDNPGDYDRYLEGIAPAVKSAGGRFIYKMRNPRFESHASEGKGPDQLTFVEWDGNGAEGFAKVSKSEEYKRASRFFTSGVKEVEFLRMSLPEHKPKN